jgi:hypothetical protein
MSHRVLFTAEGAEFAEKWIRKGNAIGVISYEFWCAANRRKRGVRRERRIGLGANPPLYPPLGKGE